MECKWHMVAAATIRDKIFILPHSREIVNTLSCLFYRWWNWGSGRLGNLCCFSKHTNNSGNSGWLIFLFQNTFKLNKLFNWIERWIWSSSVRLREKFRSYSLHRGGSWSHSLLSPVIFESPNISTTPSAMSCIWQMAIIIFNCYLSFLYSLLVFVFSQLDCKLFEGRRLYIILLYEYLL